MSPRLLAICVLTCGCACQARSPRQLFQASQEKEQIFTERVGEVGAQDIFVFTLKNRNGVQARISNFGAALLSLHVPDRSGHFEDVVRGYDSLAAYIEDKAYFGTVVGRFANRIANGRFVLDGVEHQLARNEGNNAIHGGKRGFNKVGWVPQAFVKANERGVELRHTSPDGDEGYPGTLKLQVRYVLTDANELRIEYEAVTDRPTVVNLTNHSYFNLAGLDGGEILDHLLTINANAYTPVDEALIPTGELQPVEGTPFDFRTPTTIGARIGEPHQQLRVGKGYDHNWVLSPAQPTQTLATEADRPSLKLACRVYEPTSGRVMEMFTTEPGLQFYSGNFLDGSISGKGGRRYAHRTAFVLEAQHFPDSPNHKAFPSTELRPGDTYRQTTMLVFPPPR